MGKLFTITEGLENMGALKTGGQGSVYKTRRTNGRITAIKLLPTPIHSESADDKNFSDFQSEVRKLKRVAEQPNPNVVRFLHSGITETGHLPFIEMEFIEGPDLEDLLKPPRDPLFTIKETVQVAEQLSNALAHCHKLGIRHGDVKSNNVKLDTDTGNYVLLDFGLAMMSDEQRRTSLRHAGAVEFMAPEQTEGRLLFETDIYSFGIILYELLTGNVPFPLQSSSEIARNRVLVAHLETPPPDLVTKRKEALSQNWSNEKKVQESAVPQWLLNTIAKCLQKAPENRFANGTELHQFITANYNATIVTQKEEGNAALLLQQEKERLQNENDALLKQIATYQKEVAAKTQEVGTLKSTITNRDAELATLRKPVPSYTAPVTQPKKRSRISLLALLVMVCIGAFAAYSLFGRRQPTRTAVDTLSVEKQPDVLPEKEVIQNHNIGQFKVQTDKAYFHNEPDAATRRNAYLIPSDAAVINGWDERNDFIYTEFTNERGQLSKGWLRKDDLVTLDQWERSRPTDTAELAAGLAHARILVRQDNTEAAAVVYRGLIKAEIPEAMYEYSNLGLQDKYEALDCGEATQLLEKASDKGYMPAKRTLGFLYLFAENKAVLQMANYDRCPHEKNILRGSKLLMEAVLAGDSTASKWLKLHKQEDSDQGDTN